jgi:hypothetical protein
MSTLISKNDFRNLRSIHQTSANLESTNCVNTNYCYYQYDEDQIDGMVQAIPDSKIQQAIVAFKNKETKADCYVVDAFVSEACFRGIII